MKAIPHDFEPDLKKIEEIFTEFQNGEDSMGLATLMTVLEVPEKEFPILADIMLTEAEKALNDKNALLTMIEAMHASDIKVEDLTKMYTNICDEMDNTMVNFSQQKRDFIKRYLNIIVNALQSLEGVARRVITIPISYCNDNAKQPTYANIGDAGMDVYATEDITIDPGEQYILKTGVQVAIPTGYELQVRPRSGLSAKTKLRVANAPGTIDSGYRDEIGIILENIEPKIRNFEVENVLNSNGDLDGLKITSVEYGRSFTIEKGSRIAQLVLSEVPTVIFQEVENVKLIDGDRQGGFGSSGK